jgi:hypothetical protein
MMVVVMVVMVMMIMRAGLERQQRGGERCSD